ncbi:hypothetical protein Tco_1042660 [Tanacetum coccineum]|uniref:Uncharacterized protein n=1 Tax=Tanacetum coccineum TaxID=301880 RepID=A0ABQ5GJS0_9ASTR
MSTTHQGMSSAEIEQIGTAVAKIAKQHEDNGESDTVGNSISNKKDEEWLGAQHARQATEGEARNFTQIQQV